MGRLGTFLFGLILGAAAMYTSQNYHVVRAQDGVHLVPKVKSNFDDIYVDIREFTLSDWDKHRSLAVAIVQAEKGHLLEDAAAGSFRQSLDSVLDIIGRQRS